MSSETSGRIRIESLDEHEPMKGCHGRFVHSATMTHAYWRIEQGAVVPEHRHPQEQVVNVLEGELELVLDGVAHRLRPGDVLVVPADVAHSARAIAESRVLDVFSPPRDVTGFVR
ncbi:MAG TPA: cupin domain-containing protein [Thermoanaerobaculia bacterium]|nr:cupin domain-containing protein [Thermoanaerobaculia bacterium]